MRVLAPFMLAISAAAVGTPALSQDAEGASNAAIEQLRSCSTITNPDERLACYDREVGAVIAATDEGTLQVVDQQEVEQTKRSLFGFRMPKLRIFGDDDEEITTLETVVTQVRSEGRGAWVFTTEEESVWRISETKMGWRPPRPGQTVVFKKASLGTYFIRVNGQIGVKGRRIE